MPEYIPYTTDEYQPEAPATALHFARWFQNWEAGFEGASGAPKLQPKGLNRRPIISGAFGAAQTFTGLAGFGGIEALIFATSGANAVYVEFQYSTDNGSTWSTAYSFGGFNLFSGNTIGYAHCTFDFATGQFRGMAVAGTSGVRASTTIAGASSSINAVRFTRIDPASSRSIGVFLYPNGGTA